MTTTTHAPADDLEARLTRARTHLDHVAAHLAGPGASNELVAAAYDSVASVAQVAAAELRGEVALR